ncbi:MAG: IS1182 family transposase [Pyrinomonadaceae bacterium]|nr:IS1182 family transposase [Pyrinomonadaceae bacterium]
MGKTFRSYDMNQQLLLPPDLREWLRPDHLALYVSDVVDSLDLSGILKVYEEGDGRGRPPYHPALMVKLLVYGYCTGKMSSRKLEQATYDDVAFRVLSCNQQPDHDSIAGFRQRHLQELGRLFVQVLELCERAGLVKLGHVAIDGTKIKANASKHQSLSYERMKEAEQELTAEVVRLLTEAQRIDEEENQLYGQGKRGDELPEELRDRETRLAKIRALKAELEAEAKAAAAQKLAEKEKPAAERSRKWRPKWEVSEQGEILPLPKSKRNLTDPDSRIMKDGATKTFHQAYNIQVGVDEQAQIIVATKVVQSGADQEQLIPVLREVEKNLGRMPERVSADAGYYSKAALTHEAVRGVDLHVPPNQRQPLNWEETLTPGATIQERMWHKLGSKAGREVFGKRKVIVEPVFAQVKHIRGFRQFLLRGLPQVEAEWLLVCMTHNLLKMFRATKQFQIA